MGIERADKMRSQLFDQCTLAKRRNIFGGADEEGSGRSDLWPRRGECWVAYFVYRSFLQNFSYPPLLCAVLELIRDVTLH
jgi:hypothetical protein